MPETPNEDLGANQNGNPVDLWEIYRLRHVYLKHLFPDPNHILRQETFEEFVDFWRTASDELKKYALRDYQLGPEKAAQSRLDRLRQEQSIQRDLPAFS